MNDNLTKLDCILRLNAKNKAGVGLMDVLEMRYKKHTLEECGRKFGVTRERIRQMQTKAEELIKVLGREIDKE